MSETRDREGATFSLDAILRRPEQLPKVAPCQSRCAAATDVRGWIAPIAQREKLGLTLDQACERAWRLLVEANPFPATTGRICPHPCEAGCNRREKEGAVAVQALERYLGDWALAHGLRLDRRDHEERPESIGVVGAGPAGLSFAYQMARSGYRVTVYEREQRAGGMLLRGIPAYRLPESVLDSEIQRIVDLGVELRLGTGIGHALPLSRLQREHAAVFLAIGAQVGVRLGIPGEQGVGCLTGTEYLRAVNDGKPPALGQRVAVVGGGNTAIDAARAARRRGSRVMLLYRRTRAEMPAIPGEVREALEEGVSLEELVAPVAVRRERGRVRGLQLQRMQLGAPDGSGRQRPEPLPGSEYELPVDGVIVAVSQEPDLEGLDGIEPLGAWIPADDRGVVADGVWAGGDARGPGIAALAIYQGRVAAESVKARLRGRTPVAGDAPAPVAAEVQLALYEAIPRTAVPHLSPEERLARPDAEALETIDEESFLREASRCLSCGLCFGCQNCWMYCNPSGYSQLREGTPGAYFVLDLDACEGCGKCIAVCPSGFLSLR